MRSPVARGRIRAIRKPEGAPVFTAADLTGVKPIRPLLQVLSSNLCRCTGYQNIIKAVRAAAAHMRKSR